VAVSSRRVPRPNGALFFAPRYAAMAIGAMIGRNLLTMITMPVTISHGTASGAGAGLLAKPVRHSQAIERRPVIGGRRGELIRNLRKSVRAGIALRFEPQSVAAKKPVGKSIISGWTRRAMRASFRLAAPDLFPEILRRSPHHHACDERCR